MKGLLYKELVQNKITLLSIALCCVFFSIFMGIIPFLEEETSEDVNFAVFSMMITIVLDYFFLLVFQENLFRNDERKKWAYFITATPETSTGQVRSKYFLVLVCDMAVLIWTYFFENIANAVQDTLTGTILISLIFFFWHLFVSAFDIPFMVRFGAKGGNMVHTVIFVLCIAFCGIYILFGDLSFFDSIDKFYDMLMKFLDGENISEKTYLRFGLFFWISMGCYYASYKISCKFYLKGVETYAK